MKFVTVCLLTVTAVMAGTVTHTLELSPQDVVMSQSDDYSVVQLSLNRDGVTHAWTTEPGEPLLPVVSGNVLIPVGAEVEDITVTELERAEIGTGILVHPVQPMRPLSELNSVPFKEPDQAVYGTDVVYPSQDLVQIPAGNKTGFRIAGFLYCPFEYYPASGRLVLVTKAKVTVSYREHAVEVPVLTPGQRDWAATDVGGLVVNPSDVSRMAPPVAEKDAPEIDVVIFTSSTMAPELVDFRKWLMRKGYYTEIVAQDTLSNSGRDQAEKVRNLLKQKFRDNGLKQVILAGDIQHCPHRLGYLPSSPYNVPADMYFADLDGTWDANNNNRFGEMAGDSVDLFHDIYVGRLPLDDSADAANFLRKDTTYEIVPDTGYLDDVILPSEWLWQNIDFSGRIVNEVIARRLSEHSVWQIDSGLNMGSSNVINKVNQGRHFMHYAGHGSNLGFGSTFTTSHIPSLTNIAKPFIVNAIACLSGYFDYASYDCFAEELVNAANGGAVSATLNARVGWCAPPCLGPSAHLGVEFYKNFLQGMTQGQACGMAKDFLRNEAVSQMPMRWCLYVLTLQGDPTMMMWRKVPQTARVTHPDTVSATPQTVRVTTECGDGPVPHARVAVTHLGELLARARANSRGEADVPLSGLQDTMHLKLTVTGHDVWLYECDLHVRTGSNGALPLVSHVRVDDANGRLDPGDTAQVYFVVENRGSSSADSVWARLYSFSPFVVTLDSFTNYGAIAVGDTAPGGGFRLAVDASCPHGRNVEFRLAAMSGTGSGNSDCELVVGLPYSRGGTWATLDTGNYVYGVTGNGGVGTTWWRGEGTGFSYPTYRAWTITTLMHGGLMLGTDTAWVCDNFYGVPWQRCSEDFVMTESVRVVYPPELGDREYSTAFTDDSHPQPRNLHITHRAYGSSRPDYDDFVILEYLIRNDDTAALSGLYAAIACDFRTCAWNVNDQYDYAGTDSVRNLAYAKSRSTGETLAVGIRHIHPAATGGYANCIFHNSHISDGFSKPEKMKFMDGRLRQTAGTTQGNWHAMSSSGPYAIPPGGHQRIAFVLAGGGTVQDLARHSDTAASWYAANVGLAEPGRRLPSVQAVRVWPVVFDQGLMVEYALPCAEPVEVRLFDALGREVDRQRFVPARANGLFTWQPRVAPGAYFVRVGDLTTKVVKAE